MDAFDFAMWASQIHALRAPWYLFQSINGPKGMVGPWHGHAAMEPLQKGVLWEWQPVFDQDTVPSIYTHKTLDDFNV